MVVSGLEEQGWGGAADIAGVSTQAGVAQERRAAVMQMKVHRSGRHVLTYGAPGAQLML